MGTRQLERVDDISAVQREVLHVLEDFLPAGLAVARPHRCVHREASRELGEHRLATEVAGGAVKAHDRALGLACTRARP